MIFCEHCSSAADHSALSLAWLQQLDVSAGTCSQARAFAAIVATDLVVPVLLAVENIARLDIRRYAADATQITSKVVLLLSQFERCSTEACSPVPPKHEHSAGFHQSA